MTDRNMRGNKDDDFRNLIERFRDGDVDAAEELVRRYEPLVRREVRRKLGERLRQLFDSIDIVQSMWGDFFEGMNPREGTSGQEARRPFDLESPGRLVALLRVIAGRKIYAKARELAKEWEVVRPAGSHADQLIDQEASLTSWIMDQELIQEILRRMSPPVRRVFELRAEGREWKEILESRDGIMKDLGPSAGDFPKTEVNLRQWYRRALKRIADGLGSL